MLMRRLRGRLRVRLLFIKNIYGWKKNYRDGGSWMYIDVLSFGGLKEVLRFVGRELVRWNDTEQSGVVQYRLPKSPVVLVPGPRRNPQLIS